MAKIVRMSDMNRDTIAKVFVTLNSGRMKYSFACDIDLETPIPGVVLITDVEPKDLTYPEGWGYDNGIFCNKYKSDMTSIFMVKSNGKFWADSAKYCAGDM
ncbi:MAG: hypothetical protein J6I85_01610 [Clostridia bacterium]|nr:hypothetical protein [Clostridia bacterium]